MRAPGGAERRTPGDLLAAAANGDADALDLLAELEQARSNRRTRAVGGNFLSPRRRRSTGMERVVRTGSSTTRNQEMNDGSITGARESKMRRATACPAL